MYKNYKLLLFLGIAVIFLYYSVGKYEEFSLKKSISACVLAKSKITKEITPQEARNICEEEIREMIINDETQDMFTNLLFSRVMPNLKRIGLLTDKVLPLYEKLNLTSYMDADSEFEIDWAELNKPLESSKEIDQQSEKELAAHAAQGLF